MRRPVIFLFLFFTFGIALEYHLKPGPILFFISAAIAAAGLGIARYYKIPKDRLRLACMFISAALLGSLWLNLADNRKDPLESVEGQRCTVQGRIVTVQIKDDTYYQMLITAPNSGKRLVQVRGTMDDPAEYVGKWAVIRGTVTLPSGQRNPQLFDYRLYLKTKGVRVILQSETTQVTLSQEDSSLLFSAIAQLKYSFLDELKKEMSPEAYGLMAGMLFGDCSEIGEDTYEAFQKNGIAHILSVSGIHVGILYLYISRLLGNRKTLTFYIITGLMLVFYAALSEFSPSVVRSVVMILIHIFSKIVHRRYDFLSCTAASAIGMLLVNPFYLFNAGFQLSYMAVFCLAAVLPWMNRRIDIMTENGKSELLTESLRCLTPLLIIQFGMTPLTAYLFNYFSVVSLLLNLPIIAISGIIIPLGICLIPVSFLGGIVFGVGAQGAELLVNIMLWLNELFYLPGYGFFNVVSPTVLVLLIFYGFFFLLTSEFFRIQYQRRKRGAIAAACSLVLILSLFLAGPIENDYRQAELVFVDVGQGDCLHIRTPGGKNILIDGGGSIDYEVGKKTLLPYLLKNGVKSIDLAVVTHLHTDHYLGIAQLAKEMEIKKFGTYAANVCREQEILQDTGLKKENLLYLTGGDRIQIEKDIWIDVLYPEERSDEEYEDLILNEKDENLSSLFMKVHDQGLTVLMTGDIGTVGEEDIVELYEKNPEVLNADVLKVGHHGSRYSTGDEFLDMVDPEIAVFQVGKNNFGHPHPTIIEKCRKKGIIIYRNDLNGAIIFDRGERQWHIKVLLRKNMHIKE